MNFKFSTSQGFFPTRSCCDDDDDLEIQRPMTTICLRTRNSKSHIFRPSGWWIWSEWFKGSRSYAMKLRRLVWESSSSSVASMTMTFGGTIQSEKRSCEKVTLTFTDGWENDKAWDANEKARERERKGERQFSFISLSGLISHVLQRTTILEEKNFHSMKVFLKRGSVEMLQNKKAKPRWWCN